MSITEFTNDPPTSESIGLYFWAIDPRYDVVIVSIQGDINNVKAVAMGYGNYLPLEWFKAWMGPIEQPDLPSNFKPYLSVGK